MDTLPLAPPPRPSRRSNPFLIPIVVIGGLMGVMAAYGVLAIVRDHGFNLKPPIQTAQANAVPQEAVAASKTVRTSERSVAAPKTNRSSPPADPPAEPQSLDIAVSQAEVNPPAQTTTNSTEHGKVRSNRRRHRQGTPASEPSLKIVTDNAPPATSPELEPAAPPLPPPDETSHGDSATASTNDAPSLAPPSSPAEELSPENAKATAAIVPLTLKRDLISVIALPDNVPAESLLCDIGFSPELTGRQLASGEYDMVAQKLRKRDKYHHELPLHINGAGAMIDIAIRQQNKAAICEIRAKFSLPMSGTKQLTIASGSMVHKSLNRTMNNTLAAEQSLPGMRYRVDDLKLQLAKAQQALSEVGNNPADTGLIRHNAQMKINQLQTHAIPNLNKDIARAEGLIANKSALETDIDDLNQISHYAEQIASNATLSVRFYSGDVTIPATVK